MGRLGILGGIGGKCLIKVVCDNDTTFKITFHRIVLNLLPFAWLSKYPGGCSEITVVSDAAQLVMFAQS